MATIQFDPIGKFKYTKNDCGQYHSYNDEPAIEYLDGSAKLWYQNGLIHRIDKPAIIHRIDNVPEFYNHDRQLVNFTFNNEYYFMGTQFTYFEKCLFFCDSCNIVLDACEHHNNTHHLFVCYSCASARFIKCKPKQIESE